MPHTPTLEFDHLRRRGSAAALLAAALLAACGGGGSSGSGATPPPQAITPRTETLTAVDVQVREGQASATQALLVPNDGVVGVYSWSVVAAGPVLASGVLVNGGVQVSYSAQGVVPAVNGQFEVRYCSVAPCTADNSLRRIVPVRLSVQRGLSWQLPETLFFGGQGLRLEDQFVTVGLPAEAGTLEARALAGAGSTAASDWLEVAVQAGATAAERRLRLSAPGSASLPLGEYLAQLQLRYVFADGSAPLQLDTGLRLQVRPAGCRRPESSPGTPVTLGWQLGPQWNKVLSALPVRIECWGIAASDASFTVDVPWLTTTVRGSGLQLDVVLELDRVQAASLPSALRPELQLRIASPVQPEALIPFTLDLRFADVLTVTPSTVRAGSPAEVLLTGANLDTQLTPVLLDAQGQPVSGVSLSTLRQQACGITGCEVFVAVPALAAGDWFIGFQQLPGLRRPAGLLRVAQN